ncbi:phosphoribosyl-AMP cyclohydrolase [Nitrosomonas eutropha]|nr:phosphoribosyl-AMP cyclohydrolase [Nitrosomonas eutropha]SEJ14555.1 phosphoribosyl-AMP cyclohydrolase [Nitrosomonas eutropha]
MEAAFPTVFPHFASIPETVKIALKAAAHKEQLMTDEWLDTINWSVDGLIPVIAQDENGGKILMVAWMNRDALKRTVETGEAVYWSRSRKKLWHKGEESGHTQIVQAIHLDCDKDVLLLSVEQKGGIACHTGRQSCFFRQLKNGEWVITEPVIKDPSQIYTQ